jgi:hypothetical protein
LFPLYARLGYIRTGADFVDPNFGPVWSIIWCLRDLARMRRTGSPLLAVAADLPDDAAGRALLGDVLSRVSPPGA